MGLTTTLAPTVEPVSLIQAKGHVRYSGPEDDDKLRGLIRASRLHVENHTRRALVRQTLSQTYRWFPRVIELPISPVGEVTSITYVDTDGNTQTLATSVYQIQRLTGDRTLIKPAYSEVWPATRSDTFDAVTVTFIVGYAVPFATDFDTDANQLDMVANPFADGDTLQLTNNDGALPAILKTYVNYYVVNSTADSIELSLTSGGAAITLTDDGDGDHFGGLIPSELTEAMLLLLATWYENREAIVTGTIATELPMSVKSLLMPYTSMRV